MSNDYETRTIGLMVAPKGEAIFSDHATHITIDDEADGEFVIVSQSTAYSEYKFHINPEEWPTRRKAIDRMIKECKE